jgi:DNA-directed RNA polymerase specialized sigma24 family protein
VRLSDAETYEKFAGELVRFATGLVGPSDAADVAADAFVRVLGSRSWPDVGEQRAYLYRALLNEVRMRHR